MRKQPMLALSLALFILIISGGYFYYRYEKKIIRNEQYSDLKTIADLKVNQILGWREDRLADAHVIAESPFIRQNFQRWLLSKDSTLGKDLLDRFSLLRYNYKYENVIIVSAGGKLLLGLNTNLKHIDSETIDYCNKALQDKKAFLSDFYFSPAHDTIHIDVFAPILNDRNAAVAVLVLRVNPYGFLYPLIQSWPTSSKSAETLIIRRDGDSILYENELRHISNTALKLRIPLTRTNVPAVQAVLGHVGIYEGLDYRGVSVLADIRPVPGTPWFMIAKVDQSEIFSELRYRTVIVIIITLLLLLFFGIGISWFYNNRQKNIYRKLLETGTALNESQEEFRTTIYSIGDAVITTDINGHIRNMNVVAEKLTGWKESDVVGRTIGDVFNIVNEESRDKVESPVQRVLKEGLVVGLANHTLLISKNGKEIPIADSGAPIHNEKGVITGVVLVFRDQTQERRAQKTLQESERKFRETVKYLDEGYYSVTVDGLLIDHNQAFNRILGFDIEKDMKGAKLPDFWQNTDDRKTYLKELMTRGSIMNYLINAKKSDGEKIIVLANAHLVKDENDKPVRIEGTFTDFTRLKLMEETLKESETKYRTLFENAQVGMYRSKIDGSAMLDVNKKFGEILGLTREEALGKAGRILWADPEDRNTMMKLLKEQGGILNNYEARLLAKNGEVRNVLASIELRPEEGSLDGTFVDITERKRAEEALKISKERLLFATEGANIGIWNWNIVTGELIWSDQCKALFGVPPDETMSYQRFSDALHPDDRERTDKAVKDTLDNHKDFDIEYRSLWPDESIHWLTAKGRGFYDATGKAARLEGIVLDITRRKLEEETLRIKNQVFEDSIASQSIADSTGKITHVNPAFLHLWGYTSKEKAIGYSVSSFFADPADSVPVLEALAAHDAWEGEFRAKRTDGITFISRGFATSLRDTRGELVGYQSTNLDVTKEREAEEEIIELNAELEDRVAKRTAQLEASNKELEAFSYSVSHDLRAPLRHVSGYVELLSKRFQSDLPEKGQHYLNSITDSVHIMGMLIDDLLQFSRTGRMEMHQSDFDMNEVVKEVIESQLKDNPDRKIEWVVGKLASVNGDEAMLRLVWINLLSNAVKFTRTRKKARIEIGVGEENKELVFFVRDNGVGFDMQYAQKLFGVFQRLHPTEEFEGTGIGLANVQRIVLRHGGRAWAEAEPDKGAVFYFSIPNK
ncbi:MAG: PAS domain S-box protein [Bacteroidales bacterium]|nr:PAS domain S-box protein [Bacteroidales bacterium]